MAKTAGRDRASPERAFRQSADGIDNVFAEKQSMEPSVPHSSGNALSGSRLPRCPTCGALGYDDDRFCPCCGTSMSILCPRCGKANRHPVVNYCTECGAAMRDDVPVSE
jgi:hypothetical protein